MEIQGVTEFAVRYTAREFSIVTKTLAGVKLNGEEREAALALNKFMLEQRVRVHREALNVAEGALAKAAELQLAEQGQSK